MIWRLPTLQSFTQDRCRFAVNVQGQIERSDLGRDAGQQSPASARTREGQAEGAGQGGKGGFHTLAQSTQPATSLGTGISRLRQHLRAVVLTPMTHPGFTLKAQIG